MDIWTPASLALFLAFVVPGFISQKVYGLIVPEDARDSSSIILSAVAYSSLTYALASPLLWWLFTHYQSTSPYIIIASLVLVLLILPVILPVIWLQIRRQPFIQSHTLSPIKRPWDYVFNGRNEYWVVVTFKNGEKIGGIYGLQSFSSSYPRKEQIYLQKVWVLADDGSFMHAAEESKGAIILSDEIQTIELFSSLEAKHE